MTEPTRPPSCIDAEPHHYMPLAKRTVYCTKCGQSVTYRKEKK